MLETGTEPMVSPVDRVVQGNRFAARFFLPLAVDEVADLDHGFASNVFWVGVGMGPFWDLGP